jgi:hypothetical protein
MVGVRQGEGRMVRGRQGEERMVERGGRERKDG